MKNNNLKEKASSTINKLSIFRAEILLFIITLNMLMFVAVSGECSSTCAEVAKQLDYIQLVYESI